MNIKNVSLIACGLWGLIASRIMGLDAMIYWPLAIALMIGIGGLAREMLDGGERDANKTKAQ